LIKKLSAILLGLIFIASFSLCRQAKKVEQVSPYLNHNDSVKYVGIETCKSCHLDKFETFIQTGMGMSFDSASIHKSSANFTNPKAVYDSFLNLYYLPYLKNNVFYLKEYRMENKDTVYSRTEKINYIVGSGHHTNSHMVAENGYVFQAPITFYTQKGKWDLPPGYENGNNSRFNRKIGLECMSCHNAMPQLVEGSENQYNELPHGINCERCHGPGQLHVQEMKKGNTVDINKKVDYTIVNPGKLSWQRQIDVCQRCHLQGNAVLKPNKSFTSFKPGMVLSETFDQFSPEYEDGEDFVMAAHAERFQKSKCFISSNKNNLNSENTKLAFTCISCHNPHVSVRKTNTIQFNKTCISCHQEKKCTETIANRSKQKDNCVACHMPISGTADIPHVSVHDHYIRMPSKLPVKKPSKLKGLRCITSSSPDINTVTEAYVSYFEKFEANPFYLDKAKENSKNLDVKNQFHLQTLIHLHYMSGDYDGIVDLSNNYSGDLDAWSNYRIAKAFEKLNNLNKAESFLAKAVEQNSKSLDFILQYAVLEIKLNKWKQAESLLLNYNKLYSKSAEAWAYIGLVKLKENKLSEAKSNFILSLNLDPDQAIALQNLYQIYLLSNPIEAQKIAKRIAALNIKK
jgi:hypothetical protein